MRVESREIEDETLRSKMVDAARNAEQLLRSAVETIYPITEVRINLETGQVFVVWKEYSDDETAVSAIVDEVQTAVSELKSAEDEIDRADAIARLTKLNDRLLNYGVSVKQVARAISQVADLKSQGLGVEEISNQLKLPMFVVKVIYDKVRICRSTR